MTKRNPNKNRSPYAAQRRKPRLPEFAVPKRVRCWHARARQKAMARQLLIAQVRYRQGQEDKGGS